MTDREYAGFLLDRLEAVMRREATLLVALEPFVREYKSIPNAWDSQPFEASLSFRQTVSNLTVGDFRRAAAALSEPPQ